MANKPATATVRVDKIIIEISISKQDQERFLQQIARETDDRFDLYLAHAWSDDGNVSALFELLAINRAEFYDYIEKICKTLGIALQKKDGSR